MGLKQDIEDAMNEAFDGDLADAVKQFTHKAIEIVDYDPPDVTRITLTSTGRGVFDEFNKTELEDESILPTDVKLVVLQSEFENELGVDDEIIRNDNNRTYKVVGWQKDPADVTYEIQLRSVANAG